MSENLKNNNAFNLRGILAVCLILLGLLFFLPWISSNMNSGVLVAYKNISGVNISQYASMLAELASGANTQLIGLGLALIRFIYFLPILAAVGLVLLFIDQKSGAAVSMVASALHTAFAAIYFLLPASYAELRDLMFITTPTLYLYIYIGTASLILSVIILSQGQNKKEKIKIRERKSETAPKEKKRTKISVSKK